MVRLTNKMKPGPMDHQIRHSYNAGLELKSEEIWWRARYWGTRVRSLEKMKGYRLMSSVYQVRFIDWLTGSLDKSGIWKGKGLDFVTPPPPTRTLHTATREIIYHTARCQQSDTQLTVLPHSTSHPTGRSTHGSLRRLDQLPFLLCFNLILSLF